MTNICANATPGLVLEIFRDNAEPHGPLDVIFQNVDGKSLRHASGNGPDYSVPSCTSKQGHGGIEFFQRDPNLPDNESLWGLQQMRARCWIDLKHPTVIRETWAAQSSDDDGLRRFGEMWVGFDGGPLERIGVRAASETTQSDKSLFESAIPLPAGQHYLEVVVSVPADLFGDTGIALTDKDGGFLETYQDRGGSHTEGRFIRFKGDATETLPVMFGQRGNIRGIADVTAGVVHYTANGIEPANGVVGQGAGRATGPNFEINIDNVDLSKFQFKATDPTSDYIVSYETFAVR